MKSIESAIGMVLAFAMGISLLPVWCETVANAAAATSGLMRTLVLLVFDPTEYVWKWVIVLIGFLAYGISRLC